MTIGKAEFTPRFGRPSPQPGDRVRVYRNLPLFKHRVFSIKAMDGPYKNLVLGYARCVGLEDVAFKVSEATRGKVIKNKRRTVHAYAEGRFIQASSTIPEQCSGAIQKVTYNPYFAGYFFDRSAPDTEIWTTHQAWTWGADLLVPEMSGNITEHRHLQESLF